MYRCLVCQKPFVSLKQLAVKDRVYGDYSIEVSPCCGLQSYSRVTENSFMRVWGGSAISLGTISEDEASEIALNWAIDFQKDNKND